MTPAERHREGVFAQAGEGGRSIRCHVAWLRSAGMDYPECSGRLQAAHVISRQSLRLLRSNMEIAPHRYPSDDPRHNLLKHDLDALCADPRNGLILCDRHHSAFDRRNGQALLLPYLPEHVWEFAREYGLEYRLNVLLTRDHREEAAA